jgi:hypothetical protein
MRISAHKQATPKLTSFEVFAYKQIKGYRACMKVLEVEARTAQDAGKTGQSFSKMMSYEYSHVREVR